MTEEIRLIRKNLELNVDELTKSTGQHYFKETVRLYGVGTALVKKIAVDSFQTIKSKSKADIFALCEELWSSGMLEESFIACEWAYRLRSFYTPQDIQVFEKWIDNWVDNWASCDTLCNHSVGSLVAGYPQNCAVLKRVDMLWESMEAAGGSSLVGCASPKGSFPRGVSGNRLALA